MADAAAARVVPHDEAVFEVYAVIDAAEGERVAKARRPVAWSREALDDIKDPVASILQDTRASARGSQIGFAIPPRLFLIRRPAGPAV